MSSKKEKQDWSFIEFSGFDYTFRPASYFIAGVDPLHTLLNKITGTKRRNIVKKAFQDNQAIPDALLNSSLSEELRSLVSSIHPSFMGGEYLPDYAPNETEIARIELDSTTSDVISVRARWEDDCYWYFVVDEYENEFILPVESSAEPFTLRELIEFLNGTREENDPTIGLATLYAQVNMECGSPLEDMLTFQSVSSDIYPELEAYYAKYIPKYLSQLSDGASGNQEENND
jgi:hypothetical protein